MTPVDLTTTTTASRKGSSVALSIVPLNTPHARAVAAWQASCAGEGMTLAEAVSILRAIEHNPEWTAEELIAAVPDDMFESVMTALLISTGAQLAEAEALRVFRTSWGRG